MARHVFTVQVCTTLKSTPHFCKILNTAQNTTTLGYLLRYQTIVCKTNTFPAQNRVLITFYEFISNEVIFRGLF